MPEIVPSVLPFDDVSAGRSVSAELSDELLSPQAVKRVPAVSIAAAAAAVCLSFEVMLLPPKKDLNVKARRYERKPNSKTAVE